MLNSAFSFTLYLWIRIHGPKWKRIWSDLDPHNWQMARPSHVLTIINLLEKVGINLHQLPCMLLVLDVGWPYGTLSSLYMSGLSSFFQSMIGCSGPSWTRCRARTRRRPRSENIAAAIHRLTRYVGVKDYVVSVPGYRIVFFVPQWKIIRNNKRILI